MGMPRRPGYLQNTTGPVQDIPIRNTWNGRVPVQKSVGLVQNYVGKLSSYANDISENIGNLVYCVLRNFLILSLKP